MNLLVEIIVLIEFKYVYVHIPFFFTTNKILKYDKFHAKILNILKCFAANDYNLRLFIQHCTRTATPESKKN